MSCPHAEALLAHHLDGDPAPAPPGHLDECPACRAALVRARRLDAALAEAAGREAQLRDPAAGRLEGWLDAALARTRPAARSARRPAAARWTAAAALFLAGFGAAWLLGGGAGDPVTAAAAGGPPAPPGATEAEDVERGGPIPLGTRRSPAPSRRHVPDAAWSALARGGVPAGLPAAARLGLEAARGGAALEVLAAGRLTDFGRWLSEEPPGLALGSAVDRARHHLRFVRHLRARLAATAGDDLRVTIHAALRLGIPSLDREVRRLVRDWPALVDTAVSAFARSPSRARRAAWLLDLWADLVARAELTDDEKSARLLFAAQPRDTAAELVAELRSTRHAPRRLRALLALGICGDRAALPALLERVTDSRYEEAMAAGWAISKLPIPDLAGLADRAQRPDQYLLRAVLTGARLPVSATWIDALELTPEEDAFLRAGAFSPAQFPIAATLFRQRRVTGS